METRSLCLLFLLALRATAQDAGQTILRTAMAGLTSDTTVFDLRNRIKLAKVGFVPAVKFSGRSGLRFTGTAATNLSFAASIGAVSFWFAPTGAVTTAANYGTIIDLKAGTPSTVISLGAATSLVANEYVMLTESGTRRTCATGGSLPANVWTHLAFSWSNTLSRYRFFINGVEVETTASSSGHVGLISATRLVIGGYLDGGTLIDFAGGSVSDFAVWPYPLTPEQITLIYRGVQ